MNKLRVLATLTAFVAVSSPSVAADPTSADAIVTFYSHGSELTSGLPGSQHGIYFGGIYDGAQKLFVFRDGFFVRNNRYAAFHLAVGSHVFSASYGKNPSKDHLLTLDLKAGEHYYVRARSASSGVIVYEVEHGRLDQVSCQDANSELAQAKPLSSKAISSVATGAWFQGYILPATCP